MTRSILAARGVTLKEVPAGGPGSLRISSTSRQRSRHRAGIQAGGSGDTGQPTASHAGPR